MICGRNDARQHRGDRGVVVLRQYSVEGRAFPVAGDEDGNVVLIGAGCRAVPPRLRALRGRSDQRPLKDSRMKVSSASTIPLKLRGLSSAARQEPMPPAERGGRMDAAQFRGLRQALALDHRLGVSEPLLLLAQMRHGRSGQGVERASATLAAESQQPVRAAPADDLATRAMRAARLSTRSTLVVPSASSVRLARRFPGEGATESSGAAAPSPAFASASTASPRCSALRPAIAASQPGNPEPASITSSTRRDITETIDNAIRAFLIARA